ncbi:MAG: hypothetical protein L0241_12380, partial [Planctomycetia bacterium]|nr:hypothetical protein [Planctomycetia bacterium]
MIETFISFAAAIVSAVLSQNLPAGPAETLIPLKVDPMPAPKPALRYLLLPELKEMTTGNPIPN